MSAWRIGAVAASRKPTTGGAVGADDGGTPSAVQAVFDKLTTWIPGDVIALYVAAVTALSSKPANSLGLLIGATVLTFVFVVGSAFAQGHVTKRVWVSAILATVAFVIWSLSVPLSWWQTVPSIQANKGLISIIAAGAGLLFGLFAEGVSKRVQS